MPTTDPPFPPAWWKSATVYEIYPHSFFDSNGDGIGDLNGIRAKLDYLKDLGADVLWLCPIYRSPFKDMGYDVSDYLDIDPLYGTMEDWHKLVEGVHARGMKILMDLVANHTSDEHAWFLESKSSKVNPKHDWYIWRPPRYENGRRLPPNNWRSIMQGPAWEFVPERGEYYLHLFTRYQPDLNWDNPDVRKAMADVVRFWIAHGCDGFRLDSINLISKTPGLPDAQVVDHTQYFQLAPEHWANLPQAHKYIRELNRETTSCHDVMTVGEASFTDDPAMISAYVLPQNEQLNQILNMELMNLVPMPELPLNNLSCEYKKIQEIVVKWQTYERDKGFWNTIFMENHDFGRSVTRFGNDSLDWRALSAKMLAVLQVTQTGTLYLYQGQEIGMKNFPRTWGIEEYKDVATQIYWQLVKEKRRKETGEENPYMEDVLDALQITARDTSRTPVQWDATKNVGFTSGTPWMRAYEDDAREGWNVADESTDSESVLSFWKRALRTRKEHDVLIYGSFEARPQSEPQAFVYVRKLGNKIAWVALNLSVEGTKVSLNGIDGLGVPNGHGVRGSHLPQLVLSNYEDPPELTGDSISLRAYEALVFVNETEVSCAIESKVKNNDTYWPLPNSVARIFFAMLEYLAILWHVL